MVRWLGVVLGVAFIYQGVVLVGLVVGWRNRRVGHRKDPGALGIPFGEVRIPTVAGKTLYGWWIPAPSPHAPASRGFSPSGRSSTAPVVVLVHGWGRNVQRMLPYIGLLHPRGYHLLAFDARNHGSSGPDHFASLKKFSEDLRAAVDFAAEREDVAPGRLAVLGLSIGGSAAIHAAAREPRIRAVVTVGAFANPAETILPAAPWRWLLRPGLPLALRFVESRIGARMADLAPEANIRRSGGPILLVHGEDDEIIPVDHGRRLAEAAKPGGVELWIIPGRGHSDPHLEPGFAERVTGFLAEHLGEADPLAADRRGGEEQGGA